MYIYINIYISLYQCITFIFKVYILVRKYLHLILKLTFISSDWVQIDPSSPTIAALETFLVCTRLSLNASQDMIIMYE